MGFNKPKKKDSDFEFSTFELSRDELIQLHKMVGEYGGRIKLMIAMMAIKFVDSGNGKEMVVLDQEGSIGRNVGIGERRYDTSILYTWWSEAFSQLDRYLSRIDYAEREKIFQLTGFHPKRGVTKTLEEMKQDLYATRS